MTYIDISRRALLGALGAAALPATGASASHPDIEEPHERTRRLADELSDALNHYDGGRWQAIVYPSQYGESYSVGFGLIKAYQDPRHRIRVAIGEIKSAMRALTGTEPFNASTMDELHCVVALGVLPEHSTKLRWFFDDEEPNFANGEIGAVQS